MMTTRKEETYASKSILSPPLSLLQRRTPPPSPTLPPTV
jgi:hypothetical protein